MGLRAATMTDPTEPPLDPAHGGVATRGGAGPRPWLNRNVAAMGATSLLSDASHEAATAVLPGFLAALGLPPAALGVIEGISDATASFLKLGAGWLGDRTGRRWSLATAGYALTGVMPLAFAVATGWAAVLGGKLLGWIGKGIRGPLRDAMLAESVPVEARGRAFGFHRAGDTVGAVIGPLLAAALLGAGAGAGTTEPFRAVFLVSLAIGLLAAVTFAVFVRDPGDGVRSATPGLVAAVRGFSPPFRRFLAAVGMFGVGDFAPSLLILAAATLLTPALGPVGAGATAALLYVARNAVYAAASYPVGAIVDGGRSATRVLAAGYVVGAIVGAGTALAFAWSVDALPYLFVLFVLSGIVAAVQDTLEGVATADLGGRDARATAFGALGAVNGVGDLVASAGVGLLWTLASPVLAFAVAAAAMVGGAIALALGTRGSDG